MKSRIVCVSSDLLRSFLLGDLHGLSIKSNAPPDIEVIGVCEINPITFGIVVRSDEFEDIVLLEGESVPLVEFTFTEMIKSE